MDETRHRRGWERTLWVVDMIVYLILGVAGLSVLLDPADYVLVAVGGSVWILLLWSMLLIVGGMGSFVGRASRFWIIEYSTNVLVGWGSALYLLVILAALDSWGQVGVAALVFIALGFTLRRYAELNILVGEPRTGRLRERMASDIARRTEDTIPGRRHH